MASSIVGSATLLLLLSAAALLSLLTTPVSAAYRLNAGQSLGSGQSLAEGAYLFIMQADCNLVLYDNNRAVWSTRTNGRASGCVVTMQSDGNLVIYSGSRAIWASKTNRRQNENYYLILQRDRNVVIYDNSNDAIWETGTNVGNAGMLLLLSSRMATARRLRLARRRTRSRNSILELSNISETLKESIPNIF